MIATVTPAKCWVCGFILGAEVPYASLKNAGFGAEPETGREACEHCQQELENALAEIDSED